MIVQYKFDEGTGTNVNDSGTASIDLTITASGTSAWETDGDGGGYAVNDEDNALISSGDTIDGTGLASAYSGTPTTTFVEVVTLIDAQNSRRQVLAALGANTRVDCCIFITTTVDLGSYTLFSAFGSTSGEVPDTYRFSETEGTADDLLGRHVYQASIDTSVATAADRVLNYIDGVLTAETFEPTQNAEFTLQADSYLDLGSWHTGTSSGSINQVAGAIRWFALDTTLPIEADIEDRAAALLLDDDADPDNPAAPAAATIEHYSFLSFPGLC